MRIICLNLIILLWSGSISLAQTSLVTTLKRIRPTMVSVIALKDNQYKKGAGVIIDATGTIATNTHILKGSDSIVVRLANGEHVPAKLVSILPEFDLSLIDIKANNLTSIVWGDSKQLKRGQEVINIGHSYLNDGKFSVGRIRELAFSESEQDRDPDVIEVTIPLFKGESGGPLLNRDGELIGVVTARHNKVYRSSFAISSEKVHALHQCVQNKEKHCLILNDDL